MRKVIIALFLIIVTFIVVLFIKKDVPENNQQNINKFLSYNDSFIDLSTFKYSKQNNSFNFDILLSVNNTGDESKINSPYDDRLIYYLIFNIIIEKTENPKFEAIYKGFISGNVSQKDNDVIFENSKIYYDENQKNIVEMDYYIEWLKENCDKQNNYNELIDKLNEINTYKEKGLIYQMPDSVPEIERIIGHI